MVDWEKIKGKQYQSLSLGWNNNVHNLEKNMILSQTNY